MLSRTQIDRLGDRLRRAITDSDLELLNQYRSSFLPPYSELIRTIRDATGLEPSGRVPKSVPSIVAKLRRESVRLSQIQDIAGVRLVVADIASQTSAVARLARLFIDVTVIDRSENPSHGYRAVHMVVRLHGKPVEIQVRTKLQHEWAELVEMYSDLFPGLKYGAGDAALFDILDGLSEFIRSEEHNAEEVKSLEEGYVKEKRVAELHRNKALLARYMESIRDAAPRRKEPR